MKKLAIFTGSDIRSFYGMRYTIELTNRLKDFESTIFSTRDAEKIVMDLDQLKKITRAKIVFYNNVRMPGTRESIPFTYSGLGAILSLRKFDVIYLTDSSTYTILKVMTICWIYNKKLIFGMHDAGVLHEKSYTGTPLSDMLLRIYNVYKFWVIRRIPNIHALNDSDKSKLMAMGYKKRIYRINNFLYYDVKEGEIRVNKNKFVVLFVGRLDFHQKGIDFLDKIIAKTIATNKNIIFHIIGAKAGGEQPIKKLADEHKNNVILEDPVSDEKLVQEFKNSNLFIMTSRSEGMPAVLLEAQSYGTPTVAFGVKGINDIITEKTQGKLIKPFEIEPFISEILDYYSAWKKSKDKYLKEKKDVARIVKLRYSSTVIIPKIREMLLD